MKQITNHNAFVRGLLVLMLAGALALPLIAQEAGDEEVGLADVVLALERISGQLAALEEPADSPDDHEGLSMGGGPRFDFRYFLDMGTMNDYLASRGTYTPFAAYFLPMVNSGGGTWRLNITRELQIGWNAWGGGLSSLGFRTGGVDIVDADIDGQDDYYSYASYGISVNDLVAQYKFTLAENRFYLGVGGLVGLASESFSISQNQRTVISGVVDALTGSNDWTRLLLDTGAYLTLQFQPDPDNRFFRLSLNGGFDYPIAIGEWMPSAGVHHDDLVPPVAFNAMNCWVGIGLDFNL